MSGRLCGHSPLPLRIAESPAGLPEPEGKLTLGVPIRDEGELEEICELVFRAESSDIGGTCVPSKEPGGSANEVGKEV